MPAWRFDTATQDHVAAGRTCLELGQHDVLALGVGVVDDVCGTAGNIGLAAHAQRCIVGCRGADRSQDAVYRRGGRARYRAVGGQFASGGQEGRFAADGDIAGSVDLERGRCRALVGVDAGGRARGRRKRISQSGHGCCVGCLVLEREVAGA